MQSDLEAQNRVQAPSPEFNFATGLDVLDAENWQLLERDLSENAHIWALPEYTDA